MHLLSSWFVSTDLGGLFRSLVRLETELWNRVDATLQREHQVSLAWLEFLQTIDSTPGCRVLDITRTLAITVGGASKIVDRIERAGLCRRVPNPADARSNSIVLTGSGADLLTAANATFEAVLAELLGHGAADDDLARLAAMVQQLRDHVHDTGQKAADGPVASVGTVAE